MALRDWRSMVIIGILLGYASAQFNILPVSVAESVIQEHEHKEKIKVAELQKHLTTEESPMVVPAHPKVAAGLKPNGKNVARGTSSENRERVRREDTFTRTRYSGVDRSASRNADIDSFLSELESDIAKTQPKRYNIQGVDSAPSWSYKPAGVTSTQKPFWKRWGDSISSGYAQAKNKAKDIAKGLQM